MLEQAKKDLSIHRLGRAQELLQDAETLYEANSYKGANNRAYYAIYSVMIREKFDYTKWRRDYFGDISVEDLNEAAVAYAKQHPFTMKKHEDSAE